MNFDSRNQGLNNVAAMTNRLFEGSPKEHLNREIARKNQNIINCQTKDDHAYLGASSSHGSSLSNNQASAGSGVSPCSYDRNLSDSGFNNAMAFNSGSSMLSNKADDNYNSQCFQQSSQDDDRGSTVPVGYNGKNIPSLVNSKQLYCEVVSPGQISSVTTCISEPTSSDNMELDKSKACHPDPMALWVQEDTSALSIMPSRKRKLRHENIPHNVQQALTSEHCHLQSCPSDHVEISLGTQMYGCRIEHKKVHNQVLVDRSSKPSQLSVEQLCSFEEKRFTRAQAPILTDSTSSLQRILVCYLKFKSKLVDRKEFVKLLHLRVCRFRICDCEKYCALISHFEGCHNTHCNLCQPVRLLGNTKKISSVPTFEPCPIKKLTSELEKPNGYMYRDLHARDCIVQDMQHPRKRMRMETASKFDDWSLFAITFPHHVGSLVSDEDSKEKTSKEPLCSREAVATAGTWNATADNNGGSMWSRKYDGLSGLGQSPESHINSASLNEVPKSIGNLGKGLRIVSDSLDLCNITLRTDDAISHSGEKNSVDEQSVMGWVKTSNVTSETFCCPISSSDSLCILPQVGDLGKSCQTFNDALDLDNINLGKDHDISLSEEHNLVGEQQEIGCVEASKLKSDATFSCQSLNSEGISVHPQESPIDEGENLKLTSRSEHNMMDSKSDLANADNQCGRSLENLKASGVSLTDFFTPEQIREHLRSLNQDINLNAGQEFSADMSTHTVGSNTCQLCALDSITFTSLDMFCTSCEARIKHKLNYYWTKDGAGARYCFCTVCFKNARGGKISCRGLSFPKSQLYKGKNTEESSEAWVQCDKCERWQHQICALYNSERDLKGKAKYTCPFCRLTEIEAKRHVSIAPVSGAKDLPRTKLSDYIEQRLIGSLQQERKQRAELLGKNPEDVPGVSDLKVRVVLAVKKHLRVKQQFLDILHNETYPTEFPYKYKVILLFQKVEGVDVCLFGMYVQEFGSECENPNKRSVYISYLDSVKYFRPEIKSVSGVALRTFVYHEILIGYLDYCKRLGFLTCYIWSCPPLKGEDYILHCHPETQKKPHPNKLVQWYKKMLRKAKEENVVVGFTNFYDYFFVPNGDSHCKITAARLPYFDGDYWSRAIEDMAQSIEKDNGGESDRQIKNQLTKRTMKAMGHNDLSIDATKDILVMQKLGQKILPAKDEFIVVHLQFTCTNCREAILSGSCWSCNQCSKFHLCGRCRELELSSNLFETHTGINGDKHQLYKIPVNEVAADTDDKDDLLENDIFDDRTSFLNFCEKNYYRFDTLRRAKHSSMMILHNLHSPRATTLETICSICNENVVEGLHCEICSQFHVCKACHQREGDGCHAHKLVEHLIQADPQEKNEQVQQQHLPSEGDSRKEGEQVQQQHLPSEGESRKEGEHMQQHEALLELCRLVDLLEHANQCTSSSDNPCSRPECIPIRKMFRHTRQCKLRVAGGCNHCKRTWTMLRMHSQKCTASNCTIPRCMDIKNHMRKLATKSDV